MRDSRKTYFLTSNTFGKKCCGTPTEMGKMKNTLKDGNLSQRRGIEVEVLIQPPHTTVILPPELNHGEEIENRNAQSER